MYIKIAKFELNLSVKIMATSNLCPKWTFKLRNFANRFNGYYRVTNKFIQQR